MDGAEAAALAAEQVMAVRDSADGRLALAVDFYRDGLGRYSRAELSFLRWEMSRGVLDASSGSPWWRAINDRLLQDKAEAALLHATRSRNASSRRVEMWGEFMAAPSPAGWYRAHNSSVVAGYLEHEALAEAETPAERLMINVALMRVLFTHLLVAEPQLALGVLAPLGPVLADPRRGSVGLFLDLRRAFPQHYPLTGLTVDALVASEGRLPRILDYGLIAPKMTELYEFATAVLEHPRLADLIRDGSPSYARPAADPTIWAASTRALDRLTASATRPRRR